MLKLQHCLKGAALIFVFTLLAFAQTTPAKLSVIIGEHKIKFTPLGQSQELRLEVHNSVNELIYDSGAVAEADLNWDLRNSNGQPLAPGLYAYTLSIKAPDAAEPHKHQGHLIVEKGGDRLWLTTKGDSAAGAEVAGDELLVARDSERTTAGAGYVAAGRTLAERGALQRDAQGRPLADEKNGVTRENAQSTPNLSGSGTTNRITKWVNGPLGVLGDSTITAPANGNIGIGTTNPQRKLQIDAGFPQIRLHSTETGGSTFEIGNGTSAFVIQEVGGRADAFISMARTSGNLGIGTTSFTAKLAISATGDGARLLHLGTERPWVFKQLGTGAATALELTADNPANNNKNFVINTDGNVGIGIRLPQAKLDVAGQTRTHSLQITGGADFAENFEVSATPMDSEAMAPKVEAGMVVSLDPASPGKLQLSAQAYDRRVAGIISGAGGVKPGMVMSQEGTLADGKHPVALSGRVYCWVDASQGAIEVGDLLTTSSTPGHAMKAADASKAQGAIIGKAMTGLKEGKGLVLVLVTLQ